MLPVQVNQDLKIRNEDETAPNIHLMPKLNREWNKLQPAGVAVIREMYEQAEFIPVRCDFHPRMHGDVAVLKNSHYALSSDKGFFSLRGLPSGNIRFWRGRNCLANNRK
jgi:hypothetical protein